MSPAKLAHTWPMFLCLMGCIIDVDDEDRRSTFAVHWTIEGSRSHARCEEHSARYAHVVIESQDGIERAVEVACERYSIDFELPAGSYTASVVLRDWSHDALTDTLRSDERELYWRDYERVELDFAAESFR